MFLDLPRGRTPKNKPPLGAKINWGHPLARGLQFFLLANEGSTTLFDLSGWATPAAIKSTTITCAEDVKFGPCLKGTGTSGSYVDLPLVGRQKPSLPATLSVWVNFTSAENAAGYIVFTIDTLFTGGQSHYYGLDLVTSGSGQFEADYGDGGLSGSSARRSIVGGTTWSQNRWYHVCATYTQGAFPTLYVNGVNDGGTGSGTSNNPVAYNGNHSALAGPVLGATGGGLPVPGYVDLPMIWNRALEPYEVAWLYREPFALLAPPRQRAWWAPPPAAAFTWQSLDSGAYPPRRARPVVAY